MRTMSSDLARHDDGDTLGFARSESTVYVPSIVERPRKHGSRAHKEEVVKPYLDAELQQLLDRHALALTAELREILKQRVITATALTVDALPPPTQSINQATEAPQYIPATRCWRCSRCRRFADAQRRAVTAHMASCSGAPPKSPSDLAPPTSRGSRARTSKTKKP